MVLKNLMESSIQVLEEHNQYSKNWLLFMTSLPQHVSMQSSIYANNLLLAV